jgi:hypothetical protein
MKTLVNQKETYYPCVVKVLIGRYGEYAQMNGINYSIKSMIERGYKVMSIDKSEIESIEKKNNSLRKRISKKNRENYIKTLTPITFSTIDGQVIDSVDTFKVNSTNYGQMTQGSDAHESIVFVDGKPFHARKHWSNDSIGIWVSKSNDIHENLGEYFGDIQFVDGKIYLRKS